jgi:uncharacterized peroxidase-related enzyme
MAWIKIIDEPTADGSLQDAYNKVGASRGRVSNILKIHSLHPEAMTAHLYLYKELMFGRSDLSRTEREIIAIAVSAVNNCHY